MRRLALIAVLSACLLPSAGAATSQQQPTRIVFSGAVALYREGYDRQLYSVLPSGKGASQLTLGEAPSSDPVPSPDRRLILFMRDADEQRPRSGELWVMKPDGSAQRRLVRHGSEPTWLPDSRRIAYVREDVDGIYTVRAEGGTSHLLVKGGRSPAWSADGKTFAYVVPDPLDDHVYVRRSGREFNFVSDTEVVDDIVVSSDGRLLAISGRDQIAVHRYDGAGMVEIPRPDGLHVGAFDGRSPAWAPRGHQLAFADEWGLELFKISIDKREIPRTLVRGHTINWLAWSPAGDRIVHTRDATEFDPRGLLWTVSLTGRARRVPTPVGVGGPIAWESVRSGLRFRRPLSDSIIVGEEVRHRAPIRWFDADADMVAYPSCGHIVAWARPEAIIRRIPSFRLGCSPYTEPFLHDLVLAGDRVALGTFFGGTTKQAQLEVWSLLDGSVKLVASSHVTSGDRRGVLRAGHLVGDGSLLAFSSWAFCNEIGQACIGSAVDDDHRVLSTALWRVHEASWPGQCPHVNGIRPYGVSTRPGPCQELAAESGPLAPYDADGGRVVAAGDNAVVVFDENGTRLISVPARALAAQISGSDLVVVMWGVLRHYDARTGALIRAWPLPDAATGPSCAVCEDRGLRLEDAARGLVAYLLDGKVHLLRLSDGADAPVAGATAARFGDTGLFYAYDGVYPWRGRIRFVPFDALPLR